MLISIGVIVRNLTQSRIKYVFLTKHTPVKLASLQGLSMKGPVNIVIKRDNEEGQTGEKYGMDETSRSTKNMMT